MYIGIRFIYTQKIERRLRKNNIYMPIGVPRIIYSWGEELPAQWTDIYNFIFRRRMVFLMQYLDDELCNQICGLLINIHMEDRSKELEKNEVEGDSKPRSTSSDKRTDGPSSVKKNRSPEDLLNADEDLGIDDIDTLEQLTLQKITKEWLNWNSQFFDYSDEPYLYYLAQTLSKDFGNSSSRSPYDFNVGKNSKGIFSLERNSKEFLSPPQFFNSLKSNSLNLQNRKSAASGKGLDIYSAFRTSLNFENEGAGAYSLNEMPYPPLLQGGAAIGQRNVKKDQLLQMFKQGSSAAYGERELAMKNKGISKFLLDLAGKEFASNSSNSQQYKQLSEKALGQRQLRREYNLNSLSSQLRPHPPQNKKAWSASSNDSYNEFRDYYRKQTERSFIEEESKKVFVIINSFGGSVGNGITVHDALQFIKAGSLTLGLGVAASASSLVLAGGTIGERYVTEGCHTMIHQPECLSPDHDVLTTRGWVPIAEVTAEDKIAVLKENKYLSYEHPTKVHSYPYKGNMCEVKQQGVSLKVTPNHRMYVATKNLEGNQDRTYSLIEAQNLYAKKTRYKKTAIWDKPDYDFILPQVDYFTGKTDTPIKNKGEERKMNMDILFCLRQNKIKAFLRLIGIWVAEGHLSMEEKTPNADGIALPKHYNICITQKKPEGRAYIESILNDLGVKFNYTTSEENAETSTSGATRYCFADKQLWTFLRPYNTGASAKRLPDFVWELSPSQCEILLEALIASDGVINETAGQVQYLTSSKGLAEDVCRLIVHAGFTFSCFLDQYPLKSDGPMYRVTIMKSRFEPYGVINGATEPYEGTVHCLTVPHEVFLVKRDGIPVWTGNSALQGQASDIWIDSQEIMKIRLDVADIYSLSTYRPRHKILRDLDRDFYLNAPETISYGLADEIATNEVMHEIVEMTSKIWAGPVYDGKQQRLLESRESASSGSETQTQS